MSKEESKSFADFLYEIVKDFKKLISLLILIGSFFSMLIISICIGVNFFYSRANSIEIKESGAMIIRLNKDSKTASYLLSSNGNNKKTPWVDTNIDVEEGDKITFYVSGSVCTGIHRMIQAAIADTIMPPIPWCGPEGITNKTITSNREKELKRKPYMISKTHNQGQVIGIISTMAPELRPPDEDIINIYEHINDKSYVVTKRRGHLWLTINEVFLDDETLENATYKDLGMQEAEYNFIKRNHYANVWYDDNSGFFSINMEIRK